MYTHPLGGPGKIISVICCNIVIFCEPLVCNSIHYMSTHLATVHKPHVKHMCTPSHTWLKEKAHPRPFLSGCRVVSTVWATHLRRLRASALCSLSCLSFVRPRASVRSARCNHGVSSFGLASCNNKHRPCLQGSGILLLSPSG